MGRCSERSKAQSWPDDIFAYGLLFEEAFKKENFMQGSEMAQRHQGSADAF
jgi:hypothetical protein